MNALAQSEKRQNDEDDDYQANNVDDFVHLSFLYAGLKADWDLYYARGQDENYIKAVKNDPASDRTADHTRPGSPAP